MCGFFQSNRCTDVGGLSHILYSVLDALAASYHHGDGAAHGNATHEAATHEGAHGTSMPGPDVPDDTAGSHSPEHVEPGASHAGHEEAAHAGHEEAAAAAGHEEAHGGHRRLSGGGNYATYEAS